MAKQLNKTEEVLNRLKAEQKVEALNKAEDVAMITDMNKRMEDVRREYQIKERNSQISAASVILTA